ncbi:MAG: DNA alkylation repair protein, partial [Acutalibacteraceae bacterium]
MTDSEKMIRERLLSLADPEYREFQAKLMPTVDKQTVIGVRMPEIRKLAKELKGTKAAQEFLNSPKHKYYDENTLHISLINLEKDFERALGQTQAFLPYIDNWAVCDMLNPKVFSKNLDSLYGNILKWIESEDVYTVRFG